MEETSKKKVCKDCRRAYHERAEEIVRRSGNKGGEKSSDVLCARFSLLLSSLLFSSRVPQERWRERWVAPYCGK